MLSFILLILKIIGIVLLGILGLALILLSLLLFVPVRYKGQGSYYEKLTGSLKVSWLFHIIAVKVSYQEQLDIAVLLFGFRLFKKASQDAAEENSDKEYITPGELAGDFEEEPMLSIQEVGNVTESPTDPKEVQHDPSDKPKAALQNKDSDSYSDFKQKNRQDTPPKQNFFIRMMARIKNNIRHLILSFERFCENIKKFNHTKEEIIGFINDEKNRETFRLIVKQAKKLARHVLPRRLKGRITFGLEDPYAMGQILSGAALFYPLYHKCFFLEPVFDRKMIEGEIAFKGRVRLSVFLIAGLKILLNKNFRVQLKRVLNRGGI